MAAATLLVSMNTGLLDAAGPDGGTERDIVKSSQYTNLNENTMKPLFDIELTNG